MANVAPSICIGPAVISGSRANVLVEATVTTEARQARANCGTLATVVVEVMPYAAMRIRTKSPETGFANAPTARYLLWSARQRWGFDSRARDRDRMLEHE